MLSKQNPLALLHLKLHLYSKYHLNFSLQSMLTSMGFSNSITGQSIWSKKAANHSPHAVSIHQTQHEESKTPPFQYRYTTRKSMRLYVVPSSNDRDINTNPLSPAQTIMLFYTAINDKDLKQLNELIAEDCYLEDYSFTRPFQGKKEVLGFLDQLTSCMGQKMKFNVEQICQGNDYTNGVNWHLDWNKIQIPFTRGCSFYSLSIHGNKLVIKKARVLIESPIKLGGAALTSFKIVTSIFDAFPEATEWFLKRPDVIFQLLLKTFDVSIRPIISPIVAWYIKLLNFAACILRFTLQIIYYMVKTFHK